MNKDSPLTKKDLLEALGGLEQRLEAKLEAMMDTKLNALEERLREYVHDVETGLLKAFHEYSMRNESRFKNLETFQATSTERLSSLEAAGRLAALELKVAEIEKKLDRHQ
jgi:hypothetical protein